MRAPCFGDLQIGQTFDFIGPDRILNSFYDRCRKVSTRKYVSLETGYEFTVGSLNARVYNVEKGAR